MDETTVNRYAFPLTELLIASSVLMQESKIAICFPVCLGIFCYQVHCIPLLSQLVSANCFFYPNEKLKV